MNDHFQSSSPSRELLSKLKLFHDDWGQLVLVDHAGNQHCNIHAVRAFPMSAPLESVALCDESDKELVWIEHLDHLSADARTALEEELDGQEFLPIITQVRGISSFNEPCEWDVETDRGRVKFVLKEEDDFRHIGPYRALIFDAQGVRYLIPDWRKLDLTTKRFIEQYL